MVIGKAALCIEVVEKVGVVSNFSSITCLPTLSKLMAVVLADEIYKHLEERKLFS